MKREVKELKPGHTLTKGVIKIIMIHYHQYNYDYNVNTYKM